MTTNAAITSFVQTTLPAISNRIGAVFRGTANGLLSSSNVYSINGMAAGDGERPPIGAWAGYSFTDSSNDFSSTAFSSDRHTVMLGLDTMPTDRMLLGVSVSLERSETKTQFNGGEQDVTAISLTPYAGFLLTDWLTVDMAVGIGSVSNKQFRTSGAAQITSDLKSTRVYGSVNATATWAFDRILATGHTGLLYATQDDEDFRESNGTLIGDSRSKLGRFLFGGELAYSAGAWEPYVSGTFEYDFARTDAEFSQPASRHRDTMTAICWLLLDCVTSATTTSPHLPNTARSSVVAIWMKTASASTLAVLASLLGIAARGAWGWKPGQMRGFALTCCQ